MGEIPFKVHSRGRKTLLVVLALSVVTGLPLLAIELLSACIIFLGGSKLPVDSPLRNFPAQFHFTQKEGVAFFNSLLSKGNPDLRASTFFYQFDPVLGFRGFMGFTWISDSGNPERRELFVDEVGFLSEGNIKRLEEVKKAATGKRLILTFGGSTTFESSQNQWPTYLASLFHASGTSVVIVNFGQCGYGTFNEKNLLNTWVLPTFEALGMKPDLVLSLDGVNDINYGMAGFLEHGKYPKLPWHYLYHAQHQELMSDIDRLENNLSPHFSQVSQILGRRQPFVFIKGVLGRTLPHALWLLSRALTKVNRVSETPTEKIAGVVPFSTDESTPMGVFPKEASHKIVMAWRANLTEMYANTDVRGVDFHAFLQPVLLPEFYKKWKEREGSEFPNINYGSRILCFFTGCRTGTLSPIGWSKTVSSAGDMYEGLRKKFPGHFHSLLKIFSDVDEEMYEKDSMHYTLEGARALAGAIFEVVGKKVQKRGLASHTH